MRSPFNHVELVAKAFLVARALPEAPEHGDESDLHEADDAEEYPDAVVRALDHRVAGVAVTDRATERGRGKRDEEQDDREVRPHGSSLSFRNTFFPYTISANAVA